MMMFPPPGEGLLRSLLHDSGLDPVPFPSANRCSPVVFLYDVAIQLLEGLAHTHTQREADGSVANAFTRHLNGGQRDELCNGPTESY